MQLSRVAYDSRKIGSANNLEFSALARFAKIRARIKSFTVVKFNKYLCYPSYCNSMLILVTQW
ncbi:MAG: hypothetical protein PV344_07310 [Anaplasma sp.]|nr:hypothetical protein [Anaplasma sp.]